MLPILPNAPSRTDPVNFSAQADAWVAALPAWTDAVNAIEGSLQASTLVGTSTTSLSVGTGAKGFTSQAGKAWLVGSYVFIVATTDNSKIMQGKITAYNSSTGSLVVDVNLASGTGTYASWNIGISNPAIGYNNSVNIGGGTTANWFGMNSTGTPTGLSTGIAAPASDTLGLYTNTIERAHIDASGNLLLTANAGVGYGAGSGGTVTQGTSKSTGVTLNKVSGQITMNAASLAANTSITFLVTNSTVLATDNVIVNLKGGYASYGTYDVKAEGIAAGSFVITLKNVSGGSLSEAVVLTFSVIRGSTT